MGSFQLHSKTLLSEDFNNLRGSKHQGYILVEPNAAKPGDKVLHFSYSKPGFNAPFINYGNLKLAGKVDIVMTIKATGLTTLKQAVKIRFDFRNQKTGKHYIFHKSLYYPAVGKDTFKDIDYTVKLPPVPAEYTLAVLPFWQNLNPGTKLDVWVDKVVVKDRDNGVPYITKVQLNKNCYYPGEEPKASITVVNPAKSSFSGAIDLYVESGLDSSRKVKAEAVKMMPDEVKVFEIKFDIKDKRELGHSLVAELKNIADKEISKDSRYFVVGKDARFFQTMNFYGIDTADQMVQFRLFIAPTSESEMNDALDYMFDQMTTRIELFSWSWCELAGFIPPEDPFIGSEGSWWSSLKRYQHMIDYKNSHGYKTVSYVQGHAWSEAAYRLYQKHPEWFIYDRSGTPAGNYYNMKDRNNYKLRHGDNFVLHKNRYFYGLLNPLVPECREWIANQFFELHKMGFTGVRWDVWSMEVKPGWYDMMGNELVKNWKEADQKTAESIQAIKKMVNAKIPDFTWGYNYGAPEENENIPMTLDEKCRDNGWILDETTCAYQLKTSPFHIWEKYRDRIVGWGDVVRKKGGIYNPFKIGRGQGSKYDVDRMYVGIFQVISGGRSYYHYENNAAGFGRIGALPFRFSDIYIGRNLSLLPQNQKYIKVYSKQPLWWDTMVHENVNSDGVKQLIVHMANPPHVEELEENPESIMNPPVKNIKVTAGKYKGELPTKAYIVTAEALKAGENGKTQSVPLTIKKVNGLAEITVPELIYYKAVVFEYK